MNAFDVHTLAAAYALDALDAQELELFELHLPTCEQCLSEVASFQETAGALANAQSAKPPESLRASVLANIATTRQLPPVVAPLSVPVSQASAPTASENQHNEQPLAPPIDLTERRNRRNVARAALGAVAAAVLVVVGVLSFGGDDSNLPTEVAAVIEAGDATEIPLSGATDDLGELKIVYSANEAGVALVGDGLEALDANQTYELWAIDADGARPVGLFSADDSGAVADFLETTEATNVTWGVTVEPAGGSPQPTTDPIFVSS